MSITSLDDQRPHVNVVNRDTGDIHVMPVGMLRNVVNGNYDISTIPDGVLRAIIDDWLKDLE